ncbi:MAG: endonuclease/exonuclease/phosphatase family protein [Paraburkholderia sp.]|nr:endonuclease/exonuclease/phosphatase family protein [Paraburkholderia sp.]
MAPMMFVDGAQDTAVADGSRAPADGRANAAAQLGFVSWNVHGAVGTDRMCAPERIARVLLEIDADVVALQEVPLGGTLSAASSNVLAALSDATVDAYARPLVRPPRTARLARCGYPAARRDPAGDRNASGLGMPERRAQIAQLAAAFDRPTRPVILAGDINEWLLWCRALRMLTAHFPAAPAPATFPSRWPLFTLDRVWMHPAKRLVSVRASRHGEARVASDHLPLVARIEPGERDGK